MTFPGKPGSAGSDVGRPKGALLVSKAKATCMAITASRQTAVKTQSHHQINLANTSYRQFSRRHR